MRTIIELQKHLKAQYKKKPWIERLLYPDSPLPLGECFLELALIETHKEGKEKNKTIPQAGLPKQDHHDQVSFAGREFFLQAYEQQPHLTQRLTIADLWSITTEDKKRFYMEGPAGSGKSTLSRRLAYAYGMGEKFMQAYAFVFHIKLRELTAENYPDANISVFDVIQRESFGGTEFDEILPEERALLKTWFSTHADGVLFILDGYDELQLTTPALKSVWRTLIHSNFSLLLTSRPGVLIKKTELDINANIAVMGFSDDQVATYVKNFFNPHFTPEIDIQDERACLSWLKSSHNLWSLAHIPIQLELLCNAYNELQNQADLTLTSLYESLWHNLLRRNILRYNPFPTQDDVFAFENEHLLHLEYMSHLAFLGMQHQNIILSEQEISKAYRALSSKPKNVQDFFEILRHIGLINHTKQNQQAEFIHLTFQEYFAANYVAAAIMALYQHQNHSLDKQKLLEFIQESKSQRFYEVMWWFVIGQLKQHSIELVQFGFDLLLQPPQPNFSVLMVPLLLSCWAEAGMPAIQQKDELILRLQKWLEYYCKKDFGERWELETTALGNIWQAVNQRPALFEACLKPLLVSMLADSNIQNRQMGARAVRTLAAHNQRALEEKLLPLFADENWQVRKYVVQIVSIMGAPLSTALQEGLLLLQKDPVWLVRYETTYAVRGADMHTNSALQDGLAALLDDEDEWVSHAALRTLQLYDKQNPTLKNILQNFQSKKENIRLSLSNTEKLELLISGDTTTTLISKFLFKEPFVDDNTFRENLRKFMRHGNGIVREEAIKKLAKCEFNIIVEFENELLKLIEDVDEDVRIQAAITLSDEKFGANASKTLQEKLLQMLNRGKSIFEAKLIITQWGKHASYALKRALNHALAEEYRRVFILNYSSKGNVLLEDKIHEKIELSEIIELSKIEILTVKLKSNSMEDKKEGLLILTECNVDILISLIETELYAMLLSLSEDLDWEVRKTLATTLGTLKNHITSSLQEILVKLIRDKDIDVQKAAILSAFLLKDEIDLKDNLIDFTIHENFEIRRLAAKIFSSTIPDMQRLCAKTFPDQPRDSIAPSRSINIAPDPIPIQKSWHFDPETKKSILLNSGQRYQLVEASATDKTKVANWYQLSPTADQEITSVKVIYNPTLYHKFALQLETAQQRHNIDKFKPKWATENDPTWREEVHKKMQNLAANYADADFPNVNFMILWHATHVNALDSIFRTGFANLADTDPGFFGKGIYGSVQASYANCVFGKRYHGDQSALVVFIMAFASAYPVIYGDMPKLTGKGNYSNYDAHFIPVVPNNPNDPNELNYYPPKPGEPSVYDEMVSFESGYCLPLFLITLHKISIHPTLGNLGVAPPTNVLLPISTQTAQNNTPPPANIVSSSNIHNP